MAKTAKTEKTGRAPFRPRARMLKTLGEDLISSETVAVIELVKNAYDADARRVLVRFEGPLKMGKGSVQVIDDGVGMDRETLLNVWMEPATPNRKRAERTPQYNRAVLGEKGIGRFAAARLARYLELHTRRSRTKAEVTLNVDWGDFDDERRYLDQVEIRWEEIDPVETSPKGALSLLAHVGPIKNKPSHGTVLKARSLKIDWDEAQLQALRTGLARLVSHEEQSRRDFSIALSLPERFGHLAGLVEPPESLVNPHYRLVGRITSKGTGKLKLSRRTPSGRYRSRTQDIRLWSSPNRDPACGAFAIDLRIWDRDTQSLEGLVDEGKGRTLTDIKRDLNEAAGISIYRDGFRVFPYGEPRNDWLRLDLRRVQNPTLRVSNNQIVGFVRISAAGNPELRDQSNREGLIAGRASDDLETLVTAALGRLEEERRTAREPKRKSDPTDVSRLFELQLDDLGSRIATEHSDDDELVRLFARTQAQVAKDADRVREVVSRYERLATLGQLIDVVLHDGRTPLSKLTAESELALEDLDHIASETKRRRAVKRRLKFIQEQAETVSAVFDRIEPFAGRRRGTPREISLEEAIKSSFQIYETEIERQGVSVDLPTTDTTVTVDQMELQRIIVNLLTNSLYWLSTVKRKGKIQVEVARKRNQVEVLFSDNGPGVEEEARDRIFDPYFTTKNFGTGLGLTIAGDIATDFYGGALELVDDGPLPGATFRVVLRKRV